MPEYEMKCRICGNADGNRAYEFLEAMFECKTHFAYFQCSVCECLQILHIPDDLSQYYGPRYYTALKDPGVAPTFTNPVAKRIRRMRDAYCLSGEPWMGRILFAMSPRSDIWCVGRIPLTRASRILDVGCGRASLLYILRESGFTDLLGVDPHIDDDIHYPNGLSVHKKTLNDIDGQYNLVMLHHSLEHIADQSGTLQRVSALLADDGVCLIRIPTVSSYAWEYYRENWFGSEPPRHLFLHSVKSITLLAERAGLHLAHTIYDSTAFQFWAAEQKHRGIPLMSERSYFVNHRRSIFSRADIRTFKRKARQLNSEGRGDQAAFYFVKAGRSNVHWNSR
ncbi:MAG: class I SAM-dependent methyltransferase [Planctomycetes bacterium]|nr:class I SAM-dependent methyltransferase [Planctomycetota bacterium]